MSDFAELNPPYGTIVADPPWPFEWDMAAGGRRARRTRLGYSTMTRRRGSLPWTAPRNVHSVQDWKQVYDNNAGKGHSRKPPAALDLVEAASPGPYLELFARTPRLGWDSWGHGVESAVPA